MLPLAGSPPRHWTSTWDDANARSEMHSLAYVMRRTRRADAASTIETDRDFARTELRVDLPLEHLERRSREA
jgi:hypothetical protein